MLFRNRELTKEAVVFFSITAVMTALAFADGCGIFVLAVCLLFGALHFSFAWLRYRKIQQLSDALDALLVSGKPLPIRKYNEGELSILSNQIQKMTLRLTEAADNLQSDKRYLADSLADISHQLRTPLTAMNLTAALLSAPELTEESRQEQVMALKNLLHRTQWLVEALLKLSKLDAGTVTLTKEAVSVRKLIERAAAPLAIPMDLRNQQLVIHCGQECFTGDLVWTGEALGNILKNCTEHTPEGGSITVTVQETALYTQIEVEDTGSGFSPGDIPHLFERFYKGTNAAENSYGIGLALARTIISAQNGTVQAMNGEQGAKFLIKFYKQII